MSEANCFNASDIQVDDIRIVKATDLATSTSPSIWGTATGDTGRSSLFPATPTTTARVSSATQGQPASLLSALASLLLFML